MNTEALLQHLLKWATVFLILHCLSLSYRLGIWHSKILNFVIFQSHVQCYFVIKTEYTHHLLLIMFPFVFNGQFPLPWCLTRPCDNQGILNAFMALLISLSLTPPRYPLKAVRRLVFSRFWGGIVRDYICNNWKALCSLVVLACWILCPSKRAL